MEQKLVLGPFNSPLKQIHDVMTVYLPADKTTSNSTVNHLTHSAAHYCESQWLLIKDWITLIPKHVSSSLTHSDSSLKCDLDFKAVLLTDMWKQPHLSFGTVAPLSCTTVGNRSMLLVGSSTCLPPGILPGQRRIPGTRIPPSQFVDFPAAQMKDNTRIP